MQRSRASRIVEEMKLSTVSFPALLVASLAGTAHAAPNVDLRTTLAAPSVSVYQPGTYTVQVGNVGNRNASGVTLTIDLPRTNTSPQVHIMGTLGSFDTRCTRSAQRLTCALGTINRNTSTSVSFSIALPYSTAPLVIAANATSTGTAPEATPSNNALSYTATPALVPNLTAGGPTTTRVCSGTTLASFFECTLYPSSISFFNSTLEPDSSVTLSEPGWTGAWWMINPEFLHIEYTDGVDVVELDMASVGNNCFEGVVDFGTGWLAVHQLCL
jgi:hypothetical protein